MKVRLMAAVAIVCVMLAPGGARAQTTYRARTDLNITALPAPLPVFSAAGAQWINPAYTFQGTQHAVIRVTDSTWAAGNGCWTPASSDLHIFSEDGTLTYIVCDGSDEMVRIDRSGPLPVFTKAGSAPAFRTAEFSFLATEPETLYGLNSGGIQLQEWDGTTNQTATLYDPSTCPGLSARLNSSQRQYGEGLDISADATHFSWLIGPSQDDLLLAVNAVWDRSSNTWSCRWVDLSVSPPVWGGSSTNGRPESLIHAPNGGPVTAGGLPALYHDGSGSRDGGLYAAAPSGSYDTQYGFSALQTVIDWSLERVDYMEQNPPGDDCIGGHDGWSDSLWWGDCTNANGGLDLVYRVEEYFGFPSHIFATLPSLPLWQDLHQMPLASNTAPLVLSAYVSNSSAHLAPVVEPWQGEIMAADARTGKMYRFCQNLSTGYTPNSDWSGNTDGKIVLFPSDIGGTLGAGRVDVFACMLQPEQ